MIDEKQKQREAGEAVSPLLSTTQAEQMRLFIDSLPPIAEMAEIIYAYHGGKTYGLYTTKKIGKLLNIKMPTFLAIKNGKRSPSWPIALKILREFININSFDNNT